MAELCWFADWLAGHAARHPHESLPEPDDDGAAAFYEAWQDAFHARRISADGATAASKRLVAEPPKFRRDHFPRLLEFAVEATRNLTIAERGHTQHDVTTREGAEAASRGCQRCGGGGLATVEFSGSHEYAAENRIPMTVAAYCVCAYGRWIMKTHAEKSKDIRARIPDLADVIAGRSVWRVHPSSEPEWTGTEAAYVPSRREINAAF